MKLLVEREDLLGALDRARRVTPGAKESPLTSRARLVATDDTLTIFATDLTVFATYRMPASISQGGEIGVVPADLAEMVRRMPEGARISFAVEGARAKVSAAGTKRSFTLPVVETADMPTHSGPSPAGIITIAGDVLSGHVKRAMAAAYQSHDRADMCGVAFDARDAAVLRLVATDARRVVYTDVEGADCRSEVRLLHLGAARVLAAEAIEMRNVGIVIDERGFSFTSERSDIFVPHVAASFVDYERAFAHVKLHTNVTLDVREAMAAVQAMLTVSKTTKVTLNGVVQLSAKSPNDAAEDELDAKPKGDGGTVYVDSSILLDALKGAPTSEVEMSIGPDPNPVVLSAKGYRVLIMPIRPEMP